MKTFRWYYAAFPLFTTILCIVLAFPLLTGASAHESDDSSAVSAEETDDSTSSDSEDDENDLEAVSVSFQSTDSNSAYFLNLLGTVEAETQVNVLPATSGLITNVNFREGEKVNKGDVLFMIGGVNDTDHPSIKQYEIAKANYEAAKKAYNNTVDSANAGVRSAELQLQSTKNQTESFNIDYQSLGQNIATTKDSVGLIRSSYGETRQKNERDLNNMLDDIYDMEDKLYDFDDDMEDALRDIKDQIWDAPDEETRRQLVDLLEETKDQFDTQRDVLEDGLLQLERGYDTLRSGTILAENQILGQLKQVQAQEHSLNMTQDSMQFRLGLFDGTSDPVKLATQGVVSARAQSNIAVAQAQAGLKMARLNLELSTDQMHYLQIKAPVGGVVGTMNVKVGDMVASSVPVTQITGENEFLLKVGVDIENAGRLTLNSRAEVMIGDRYVRVPVRSIAPSADAMSRMVNVTLELPRISLRSNQTMNVRIEVAPGNQGLSEGNKGKSIFVPLDVVIIGTEEQFLFILDGKKAKKVIVELGEINGDVIEVVDGLGGDEKIIVDGAKEVTDGQSVTLK